MQANSNATTSAPWPAPPPEPASGAHWRRAFAGTWAADWRERRRDRRVWLVVALGVLLALAASALTALDMRDRQAARADANHAERARWLGQKAKYPHAAAHYGVYVFKPIAPLAAVDPGVERFVGSGVWLEAHKQNELLYRPAADEAGAVRLFTLTPALVLQVLAPLAIVFLGFGTWAGERERGSLATLRMSGAPLGAVAAARGAVLLCLGLAIAAPACAGVALVQALHGTAQASPCTDPAWRAAAFAGGYLLYLGTWCATVAGVSALSATARSSLALALGLWAATALVLPRVAVELAQSAAALPSAQAFRQSLDADLDEPHDLAEEARTRQALLAQYRVGDIRQLPVNWAGISLQRGEDHGNVIFDAHYRQLHDALGAQSLAALRFGWLSPTVAVAALSSAAAATDTEHHLQFVRAAEAQRRLIQRTLNVAITAHPERNGQRVDGDAALWAQVPPFRFRHEALAASELLLPALLPLVALFIAALALCSLALRRLARSAP